MQTGTLFSALAAALLLIAAPTVAMQDEGCVRDECHAGMGMQEFVHGPVGARICTICHRPAEGKEHEFVYAAEKEELCFGCHETSRDMMLQQYPHTPVARGNCVGCHDPHQSNYRYSLKGQAADLCYQCHDRAAFSKPFVHGPVGVGDCNVCHNPHASANENQLVAPPGDFCYTCHKEQAGIASMRHVHPPVAENCTNCHDPHSDSAEFLLGDDLPDYCFSCHQDLSRCLTVENRHEPVATGQCDKCHDVHASEYPRMFPRPQVDLCLSCHEELSDRVATHEYKHGPVNDGDCNACHDPHGSAYFRILRDYFPKEFYKPYATENYAICFQCHNKDIALDERTTTLTDFRDGDVNMHYLHVNKDVKGRSCKACHEAHASNQMKHVRQSVPFGQIAWDLPVTYTKFDNGGSCVVGCHAPKEYRR